MNDQLVRGVVQKFPPDNYALLQRLIFFLKKVTEHPATKMTPDGISVVMSMSIMRSDAIPAFADTAAANALVTYLIINCATVFGVCYT